MSSWPRHSPCVLFGWRPGGLAQPHHAYCHSRPPRPSSSGRTSVSVGHSGTPTPSERTYTRSQSPVSLCHPAFSAAATSEVQPRASRLVAHRAHRTVGRESATAAPPAPNIRGPDRRERDARVVVQCGGSGWRERRLNEKLQRRMAWRRSAGICRNYPANVSASLSGISPRRTRCTNTERRIIRGPAVPPHGLVTGRAGWRTNALRWSSPLGFQFTSTASLTAAVLSVTARAADCACGVFLRASRMPMAAG